MRFAAAGAAVTAAQGVGFSMSPAARRGEDKPASRPNIILIMADDMGYSDIGCYGSEIDTPHIDALAGDGLRFTQFYNAARCCPTRASLLTGLYPHQAGMGGMVSGKGPGPYQGYLNNKCVTIAEVLKDYGYRTLMSGKWHVGENRPNWPTDRGFEKYFGLISGAANYFDITKPKFKGMKRKMAMDGERYMPPKEGFYMTDAISDHAVELLGSHGSGAEPFFLYVPYTAPHWPLHAWPEDIARYRGKYKCGWSEIQKARHERQLKMGIVKEKWPLAEPDEGVQNWESVQDKDTEDLKMAIYAAQVNCMDRGIGKILDKLKTLGKEQNTLVMFLSDNGGCNEEMISDFDKEKNPLPPGGVDSYTSYGQSWANASNTPFRFYKFYVHEGGIATPLIARWPAVIKQKGKLTDQVGHIVDIMATCCELAGAEYPKTYQGREVRPLVGKSLVPILKGLKRKGHETLFWEHMGNRAMLRGKWKLVCAKRGEWELYDIRADRTEVNNLAGKYPQKVEELKERYLDWAEKCGVEM